MSLKLSTLLAKLLPHSLVGRIYALYVGTLLLFVGLGSSIFLYSQFINEINDAELGATVLLDVTAPTVADSAVIGDYDTIKRTLEKGVNQPSFAALSFLDVAGGRLTVKSPSSSVAHPPAWLMAEVERRLYDINHNISVGGKDYGVLRLSYANDVIAQHIWAMIQAALLLSAVGLAGGVLLIHFPLRRWLGSLDRVQAFEAALSQGQLGEGQHALAQDVPAEFKPAFLLLERTAQSLQSELADRRKALRSLHSVLEGLLPPNHPARQADPGDIQAVSAMVAELVSAREVDRVALANQKLALDQHAIVCVIDTQGHIKDVNDAFCHISGYSRDELMGRLQSELFRSNLHPDSFFEELSETVRGGRVWQGEVQNRTRNGGTYWASASVVPFLNTAGEPYQYVAILTDITKRKQFELALTDAKEQAESASRAKSEFLANMSHEIRTPMNGILGMTELTLETELTDTQREYIGIVHTSAESLLTIINDILDFSKIEAGRMLIESHPFSLPQTVNETLRTLALRAEEKGLELLCEIDPDVAARVEGDSGRLRQVLLNLMGNAIKFTAHGEVHLSLRVKDRRDDHLMVEFAIRDTGIGIAQDKQQHIFEAFAQEDSSTSRRYGGSGLGLSICKRLVDLMGGQLGVESRVGVGSTFHFTLPLRALDQQTSDSVLETSVFQGRHFLVVDDNPSVRRILHRTLTRWGASVVEAPTIPEALPLWRRSEQAFDAVLVDGTLPGLESMADHRPLRRADDLLPPVILLSSSGSADEIRRRQDLGLLRHLPKPVAADELAAMLYQALAIGQPGLQKRPARAAFDPEKVPVERRGRHPKVLLVEDNVINMRLALLLLEKRGCDVTVAGDGLVALGKCQSDLFDLVLMDMQMPVMDGLEATRRIRAEEAASALPRHQFIVAMTANAMQGDRELCLEAGMDEYLSKPIRSNDLFAMIERAMERRAGLSGSGATVVPLRAPEAPAH